MMIQRLNSQVMMCQFAGSTRVRGSATNDSHTLGAVHKVRHAILEKFCPLLPLSHIVTHLGTPLKYVAHLGISPRIFSRTCIHTYVFTGRFVLVRGVFVWKVLFGVVFVRCLFCQNSLHPLQQKAKH